MKTQGLIHTMKTDIEYADHQTGEVFALAIPDPKTELVPVGFAEEWILPAVAAVTDWNVLNEIEGQLSAYLSYAEAAKRDRLEFEKALRIVEKRRGELLGPRQQGRRTDLERDDKLLTRMLEVPDSEMTLSRWRQLARWWDYIWPFARKAAKPEHVTQAALLRLANAAEKYLEEFDDETGRSIALNAAEEGNKPEEVVDALRRLSRSESAAADTSLRDSGDHGVVSGGFVDVATRLDDASVPLIFTDPPYHDKTLHLYEDLGRIAARVLENGGSLITYTSHHKLPEVIAMIQAAGLTFFWPLAMVHTGQKARMREYGIVVHWKPLLWFVKGPFRTRDSMTFVDDLVMSERQKGTHAWQQSTAEAGYYIEKLTVAGELVFDPFCGGGTTAVAAKRLGRRWLTCDVDKTSVTLARKRIKEAAGG